MRKEDWNEGLNNIDPDIVEEFAESCERIEARRVIRPRLTRIFAVAACFCLVVAAIVAVPMLGGNDVSVPIWDDAVYAASDIAKMFTEKKYDGVATNAYQTVYTPSKEYISIVPPLTEEYADIYSYTASALENGVNEDEFKAFIDNRITKLAQYTNTDLPEYEIKRISSSDAELKVSVKMAQYSLSASQNNAYNVIYLSSHSDDRRIYLDSEAVEIDQRLSDNEIINSLSGIKSKLFDAFGVSFSDTRVVRHYTEDGENGVGSLYIYFFNEADHGLNSILERPFSDYICIDFDNYPNYKGDIESDSILSVASIRYRQNRFEAKTLYRATAKAKLISLADAEALLYNGYVFGGHVCALCMAEQDKVDFEGYDLVGMTYIFGHDSSYTPTEAIPFYTFYKEIGKGKNGNTVYAKTYVAAIEVKGYKEYFDGQRKNHR